MGKKKKIALISIITLVSLFVLLGGGAYAYIHFMLNKVEKVNVNEKNLGIKEEIDNKLSTQYGDIQNIALFGIDAPDGQVGRSDSIMIATIDRKDKKVKLTSLMRDSYVQISGRNKDKINHAYAFGGPELAIKTINENFDLNIKNFATVDFSTLPKIVDIVGGIEMNIDDEELKHLEIYGVKQRGTQHLNGEQALAYSRIRYATGGDYRRTERQREVMQALFSKLIKKPIKEYPTMLSEVLPMVKTNLDSNDMLAIASDISKIGGKIEQERLPRDGYCEGKMINSIYYLTFNEKATKEQIHNWIFEDKK